MSATCETYRDALSAIADGETSPVGDDALRAHLDGCARCTAFAAATDDVARRLRVAPAEPVPDLTAAILAAVETPDVGRERARSRQLRGVLALVGVLQLALALPALLALDSVATHVSREVGIFEAALAVGFLVIAWRPARAGGLLPVAAVAALLVTATSLGDVVAGTTTPVQETAHLLEVVGTALLWALDRRGGRATLDPAPA